MKISSSTVEYSSTHFLGTQEQDCVYTSTDAGQFDQKSIHAQEQKDVAYDVQLTGKAAQEAGVDASKGIYQAASSNGETSDIAAISEAELAKLSPEERQKVQLVQNYVGLITGGKSKVVLTSAETETAQDTVAQQYTSINAAKQQVVNANTVQGQVNGTGVVVDLNARSITEAEKVEGTISNNGMQLAGNIHSEKTTDIDEVNVRIDTTHAANMAGHWQTVGTITENSQSVATGKNSFVLGQTQGAMAGGVAPTNAQGTITYVGDTPVFTPFLNDDGRPSGIRVGDQYSNSKKITEEEYTAWSEKGTIHTEDGRVINVDKTSLLYRTAEINQSQSVANIDDPLVIQYGEGNVELTDEKYSFDLNADGQQDGISFVKPGAGFLALDSNGDGKINDGNELFGTKSGNGFKDLAKYDGDGNGWIDENDEVYNKLSIWSKDAKGNDQLMTLKEAGVGAIYLGSTNTEFAIKDQENKLQGQVRQSGFFLREDGTVGTVQQIDLVRGNAPVAEQTVSNESKILANSATESKSVQSFKQTNVEIHNSTIKAQVADGGIILHNEPLILQGGIAINKGGIVGHIDITHESNIIISSEIQWFSKESMRVSDYQAYKEKYSNYQEFDLSIAYAGTKEMTALKQIQNSYSSTFDNNQYEVRASQTNSTNNAKVIIQMVSADAVLNFLKNILDVKNTKKDSASAFGIQKEKVDPLQTDPRVKNKVSHSMNASHQGTNIRTRSVDVRL